MDVVGSINETKLAEFRFDKRGDCEHRRWCVHDHAKGLDHGLKWLYLALQQKPDRKSGCWWPTGNDQMTFRLKSLKQSGVRIVDKAKLVSWLTEQLVFVVMRS